MKRDRNSLARNLEHLILDLRGQKVICDADLAEIYGVTTKVLNQAVKRNRRKFPSDFLFQVSLEELERMQLQGADGYRDKDGLRSQIVTSKGRGGRRYRPYVFTEHGAIMAANVLNSPRAVDMSVFVVRAFVKMRSALSNNRELARQLVALEKDLKERLDVHEAAIVSILQRVMDIIDPPSLPEPPRPPKKGIGFQVKERRASYRTAVA